MTVPWALAGRVSLVLLGLALVGGLVGYAQRYARASGEVAVLGAQRDQLVEAARANAADRDSVMAVTDTTGDGAHAADSVRLVAAVALGNRAATVVERIVEVVPDSVATMVRTADSLRVAQVDSVTAVAAARLATIGGLRVQISDERLVVQRGDSIDAASILNLELQVAAFQRVARTGWLNELGRNTRLVAIAGTVGAGLCYLFCPEKDGG